MKIEYERDKYPYKILSFPLVPGFNFLTLTLQSNIHSVWMAKLRISWLTVSNQIVKSLSLSYKKFYFFNIFQTIDLIFCKMVEIIEQNIFNRADFLFRS